MEMTVNIPQVYINAKLVDFLQAAKSRHKVAPGCNMYQVTSFIRYQVLDARY